MIARFRALWRGSTLLRRITRIALVALVLPYLITPFYRWFWPVSTQMLWRMATFSPVERRWTPLSEIGPPTIVAVIVAEDSRFCLHHGVDFGALAEAIGDALEDGELRGASTITMQVARTLFLWQGRSYLRKLLELPLALWLDLVLPKRRILELYLNVAEWGDGRFGVTAAAYAAYGRSTRNLSPREAALLVAALPAPTLRDAAQPTERQRSLAAAILRRLAAGQIDLACLSR
jgi:monofunctional biosynthetic peptidoglycan transglycosylase